MNQVKKNMALLLLGSMGFAVALDAAAGEGRKRRRSSQGTNQEPAAQVARVDVEVEPTFLPSELTFEMNEGGLLGDEIDGVSDNVIHMDDENNFDLSPASPRPTQAQKANLAAAVAAQKKFLQNESQCRLRMKLLQLDRMLQI